MSYDLLSSPCTQSDVIVTTIWSHLHLRLKSVVKFSGSHLPPNISLLAFSFCGRGSLLWVCKRTQLRYALPYSGKFSLSGNSDSKRERHKIGRKKRPLCISWSSQKLKKHNLPQRTVTWILERIRVNISGGTKYVTNFLTVSKTFCDTRYMDPNSRKAK